MKTYKEQTLRDHIPEKGIVMTKNGRKLFKQFDYFQVINGYKYLFIDSIEKLEDIKNKIHSTISSHEDYYSTFYHVGSYSSKDDLYFKICKKICEKYGIDVGNKPTITALESEIDSIHFERHIFRPESDYEDFVRVYLFEHELRSVLLKHILFIEERIKKVFISVLNNTPDAGANCLADISNYDLSRKNNAKALGSLEKIISMHSNKNSKPIVHKMEQELIVPYWIIINEMTLKQTLITINCLKDSWSETIKQALSNELSKHSFDINNTSKTQEQIKEEKKDIKRFIDMLFHLADFRNHLAHNQPIYCYNVKKHFPKLEWIMPYLNKKHPKYKERISPTQQQRNINLPLLSTAKGLFGPDAYNERNNSNPPFDINLSWIIYLINRITNVINPKNDMKESVCDLYKKYNMILSYSDDEYSGKRESEILSFISKGNAEGDSTLFGTTKLQTLIAKALLDKKKSNYLPFSQLEAYNRYTNIDANFLINIIC